MTREAEIIITEQGEVKSRGVLVCKIAPGEQVTLQSEGYTVIIHRKLKATPFAKLHRFKPKRIEP